MAWDMHTPEDGGDQPFFWSRQDRLLFYPPSGVRHWLDHHKDIEPHHAMGQAIAMDILVEYAAYRWAKSGKGDMQDLYLHAPHTSFDANFIGVGRHFFAYRHSPSSLLGHGYGRDPDSRHVNTVARFGGTYYDTDIKQLHLRGHDEAAQQSLESGKALIMVPDPRIPEHYFYEYADGRKEYISGPCDLSEQGAFVGELFIELGLPMHLLWLKPYEHDVELPGFAIDWDHAAMRPVIEKILEDKEFADLYSRDIYVPGWANPLQHPYTGQLLNIDAAKRLLGVYLRQEGNWAGYAKAFISYYDIDMTDKPKPTVTDTKGEGPLGGEPGHSIAGDKNRKPSKPKKPKDDE